MTGLTFVELNETVPLSSAAAKNQKKTRVIFSVSADKTGCATMLSKSGNNHHRGMRSGVIKTHAHMLLNYR